MDWLIAGLGNPGRRYAGTRHNVGRDAVEALAARHGIELGSLKHNSRYGTGRLGTSQVCLAIPTTYMNESGRAVAPLASFYRVPPERLILVYDEIDLPLGRLRVRVGGGTGGHKGVRSVRASIGDAGFVRVRMGVGRPPDGWDAADHVLARFSSDEEAVVAELRQRACTALEDILELGVELAMNRHNQTAGQLNGQGTRQETGQGTDHNTGPAES